MCLWILAKTSVFGNTQGMGDSLWLWEAMGKSLARGVWAVPKISPLLCISRVLCYEHWIVVQHWLFVEPEGPTCCLYEWFLCSWYWQYVCHFYFLCEQTIRMRATAMIFSRRHPILEIPGVFFKQNIWGQQKPWHFFRVLAWFSLGWMMEKYPRSMATFACNMDTWPRQVPRKGGRGSHSSFCWKGFLEVHK